jgi:hypothetical protein
MADKEGHMTFEDEFKSFMVNRPCDPNLEYLMSDCRHFWNAAVADREERIRVLEAQVEAAVRLLDASHEH